MGAPQRNLLCLWSPRSLLWLPYAFYSYETHVWFKRLRRSSSPQIWSTCWTVYFGVLQEISSLIANLDSFHLPGELGWCYNSWDNFSPSICFCTHKNPTPLFSPRPLLFTILSYAVPERSLRCSLLLLLFPCMWEKLVNQKMLGSCKFCLWIVVHWCINVLLSLCKVHCYQI